MESPSSSNSTILATNSSSSTTNSPSSPIHPSIVSIKDDFLQNNSNPIPKNAKQRRQRALSLSSPQKPPNAPVSPINQNQIQNQNQNQNQNLPKIVTTNLNLPPNSTSSTSPTRANGHLLPAGSPTDKKPSKFDKPTRKVSFKDKLRKIVGMNIPESPNVVEPRVLRFHFSVSTTSSKDPREIVLELERVLALYSVPYERDKYLFLCRKNDIAFELEICKLPRMSLVGLRFFFLL